MRKLSIAILFTLAALTANASPYDGLYGVPAYISHSNDAGQDEVKVLQGTGFLNLFELEGGSIVATLLNPHNGQWQAYQGKMQGNIAVLTSLYSLTNYGHKNLFTEQEIRLEFNTNSTGGLFSHTLIANPNRVISGNGRFEAIKAIKLTKVSNTAEGVREAMYIQPGQQFELIPLGPILQLVPKTSIAELRSIAREANPSHPRNGKDRV